MSEEADEIVVVGRRDGGISPVPLLTLSMSTGGTTDIWDIFPPFLRRLLVEDTDFDIDETFTAKQKEMIIKAIEGVAAHPELAAAFNALIEKGADINIRPATRSDQLAANHLGGTTGLNEDDAVSQGATIDIYIALEYGSEPRSAFQIAITVVHELVHALGVPEFQDRLHDPKKTWDEDLTRAIFHGYDFFAAAVNDSNLSGPIVAPEAGGHLAGTSGHDIFSGSNNADIISPGVGGSTVYSGLGDDSILIELGGALDIVVDDGGADRIVLDAVDPASVSTRWSEDGADLMLLVNGVQEALIEYASGVGAVEVIQIGGMSYGVGVFTGSVNAAPVDASRHVDHFGTFSGGTIASGSTSDANGDVLSYRLGAISGDYSDRTGASIR